MATGGTIPTNRTQSVSFYDTTGIIERHKNIYYAPMFTTAGGEVRNRYLSAFNVVCPPSSVYSNISLSSWSPQDRTLVVKGNIDDFRLVTEEGECLNYFIITRNITKGEGQSAVTKTYYYAFFITKVEQSGGSSITISCVPDDFTNVFYLHNKETTTVGYDPFNDKMKNCYVNRQHYNRVELETVTRNKPNVFSTRSTVSQTKTLVESEFPITNFSFTEVSHTGSGNYNISLVHTDKYRVIAEVYSDTAGVLYSVSVNLVYDETVMNRANINVFLNQEESFRFKYQYKDMKFPISVYDSNFTKQEIETIENEDNFSSLSVDLQKKILRASIYFFVVETKSPEICLYYRRFNYNNVETRNYRLSTGNKIDTDLYRSNVVIAYPFILLPEQFRKYYFANISQYKIGLSVNAGEVLIDTDYSSISKLYKSLNSNAIADYINSCYITKDICFDLDDLSIDTSTKRINFNGSYPSPTLPTMETLLGDSFSIGGIRLYPPSDNDHPDDNSIKLTENQLGAVALVSTGSSIGLIMSGRKERQLILNAEVKELSRSYLVENYYDEVLEAEPYSFYSLSSYSAFELVFNKYRYYSNYNSQIKINYFTSFNGGNKISYVPSYTVEGIEIKYFNEALTFTLTNMYPLISDSYSSYYYQNMAQMKNQYAVNDYNRRTDLLQHIFISGPNAVGMSAGRGGKLGPAGAGAGALLETGNQVMQMVDEGIDWAQSNKQIEMNQKAKLLDMGAKPDVLKEAGSELFYDIATLENGVFFNHYTIDQVSYNSIAKLLERTGYQVNRYDILNTFDRVGWNFIKLNGFDWNPTVNIMVSQEESIRTMFLDGVTLLHNKTYLTSGHNFETILNE